MSESYCRYLQISFGFCFTQETSTDNTQIYFDSSNTEDSLQRLITYFWATTSIEGSNLWKPSVCCWPTKSNTQRISFCCGAITSAPPLIEYTVFMMSASGASTSNCGKPLPIASIVCRSPPLSMKRFSVVTEVSVRICRAWNRSGVSWDLRMCLILVSLNFILWSIWGSKNCLYRKY